ncbi:MAG: Ig-like domain-containing protein [Bacillaceae bacterium]|nr:Ig-like domain-containing protein [Bacillaceae bacterium]
MGIIKSFFIFMLIFLQHPVQPVFELLPVDDQPDLIIVENIPQITPDVGKLHTIYLHADGDFTKVNEGVTWHSSNEAVASVDQIGNIRYTGRSGKAYISVTDGVKKDRIKIGVTKDKINVVKEEAVKYNIIYDALNSLTLEEKNWSNVNA